MKKCLILLFLLLSACSTTPQTFVPLRVHQTEASFDGQSQDSGIKDFVDGKGFVLSNAAVLRYKTLAQKFNEEPIGLFIENNINYLNNEGMIKFLELNDKNLN